ncbi:Calcineurin-like phosphoesterase [Pseudomonas frederiksbergensis]|jgi:Predicted phosphoesterase|uniref:Calcineurin-like phosphoesterase n=1 Tax=Pseudomonas frederiksbergensis TaxID=104087 RepID=A0A1H5F114_9PSED|nr:MULTISPECIES: metallophosphoesterase [Pseudomonas]PMU12605.1 metallophosphoesterase [Pseudomonas sp. FW305-20]PMU22265.1 metallophosphoesterase [Pseudomonas sp. FW305-122]PMU43469.1 metallophosphoesterase [Pseudomonas sp. FW305-47B]PMX64807.1 metallophosphoesterase [Pseudomonas sp. FW305-33]PMX71072.1 metallophosphoesterase [Pseudomonas sp. FW305-60]
MRIALLSDIHLSVNALPFPDVDADIVVLAGDISRPAAAIEWAKSCPLPIVYVAGNHEFYGSDLISTYEQLNRLSQGTRIHVLERSEHVHDGVRFLGCTLWSDYRLFDSAEDRARGVDLATKLMRDYTHIKISPDFPDLFTPAVSQLVFLQTVAWLEDCFTRDRTTPTVVVSHFAPTRLSISPLFENSPINASFVSDLEERINVWQPALWLHGHTHGSFDYAVGKTRVICNPRGYAKNGVNENPQFNDSYVIDLDV